MTEKRCQELKDAVLANQGIEDLDLETYNWRKIVILSLIIFVIFRKELHMIENRRLGANLVGIYSYYIMHYFPRIVWIE